MDEKIVKVLMDIQEGVYRVERQNAILFEQNKELTKDLQEHSRASLEMRQEVNQVKGEVAEAKVVLSTLKWIIGGALVTMPAIAATLLKLYNSI